MTLKARINRLAKTAATKKTVVNIAPPSFKGMTAHEAVEAYRIFCNQGCARPAQATTASLTPEEAAEAYRKFMA